MFGTGYSALKEEHKSHSSHPSLLSGAVPDSQPSISSLDNQVLSPGSGQAPRDSDDLYTWMAKHQDFVEATNDKVEPGFVNKGAFWVQ